MAKKKAASTKKPSNETKKANGKDPATKRVNSEDAKIEKLRQFIRTEGSAYLSDANITSIGIGRKVKDGQRTNELCIQFTVKSKPEEAGALPESVQTKRIPESLIISGMSVATDVLQRSYKTSVKLLNTETLAEAVSDRKKRLDPIVPGISISHPSGTAGTFGMVVYDNQTGAPCVLSNWHVLHTGSGKIGDQIVQPGPFDDNNVTNNSAGVLLRSHLGAAGDCAIARIDARRFKPSIFELNVTPAKVGQVDLGDHVVKSGRTTGVTHGVVRRIDVMVNMTYDVVGQVAIGGFEIEPVAGASANFEISQGGDSGSIWLISNQQGKPTDIFAGLHFAGEGYSDPEEHAIACYAHSVIKKLDVSITPRSVNELMVTGYDHAFLSEAVALPTLSSSIRQDAFKIDDSPFFHYTHFTICQSKSRRLPRFVAWNIDGSQLKSISRQGLRFKLDPRVDSRFQVGDALYAGNKLDRGHIARRADLTWGSMAEAKKANIDSFFFTNITPQHEAFNQSSKSGLWGQLENAILESVEVEDLRISVMAGPIFREDDQEFRGVQIPAEFWKLVAFKDSADSRFKVKAYIVTQRSLLDDIESLELDPFRLFQVSLAKLEQETGLGFSFISAFDDAGASPQAERLMRTHGVREIESDEDLHL
jgi:endonuclease G, mitochondrial